MAGGLMVSHGVQGLMGGEETWSYLGQVMMHLGIGFGLPMWGLMAVIVQSFGGLFFLLGLFFRTACAFLACIMAMAVVYHIMKGDCMMREGGQALLYLFTFLAFLFIGPGAISVCKEGCCDKPCNL
jgi:putative oxidoreductase